MLVGQIVAVENVCPGIIHRTEKPTGSCDFMNDRVGEFQQRSGNALGHKRTADYLTVELAVYIIGSMFHGGIIHREFENSMIQCSLGMNLPEIMKIDVSIPDYFRSFINELKDHLNDFSFGSVSAVITSLAIITGLDVSVGARYVIVGSLMVIALADNISDTLGIHIYKEGESIKFRDVWRSTLTNFIWRLLVTLGFVFFVITFPPSTAIIISVIYGLSILSLVSYAVARKRKIRAQPIILEHLVIAVIVVLVSKFITLKIPHKAL
jgi:vacuolar iron transporter family protein